MGYREVKSPLAHFHIHHTASSKVELHPFTTTTHLASQKPVGRLDGEEYIEVDFLFREMESKGSERPLHPSGQKRKQWTSRLASIVNDKETSVNDSMSEENYGHEERCIGFPYQPEKVMTRNGQNLHPAYRKTASDAKLQVSYDGRNALDLTDSEIESNHHKIDNSDSSEDIEKSHSGKITGEGSDLSSGSTTPTRHEEARGRRRTGAPLLLRLEGPYFTAANPMAYETIVCLVAGTGITGALAIAEAFQAHRKNWKRPSHFGATDRNASSEVPNNDQRQRWSRCVVIWTVRADDYVEIPKIQGVLNSNISESEAILLTRFQHSKTMVWTSGYITQEEGGHGLTCAMHYVKYVARMDQGLGPISADREDLYQLQKALA